ncbi:hypothetical protein OS493_024280 [Desmophyllum pertusum]|uniref:Uncharacterized protein n=1 Tax=Desmophyllum pertusum TaxID=174260 RepID=A0A9W9Z1P6_9CNID|nr:hypothetical protein OS493_024280 [Desmophyllum pertusum]
MPQIRGNERNQCVLVEGSSSSHVKSFQSYRKSKGKEWKDRVSKSDCAKKRKEEDVVINIGLLEWKKDNGDLKPKREKASLKNIALEIFALKRYQEEIRKDFKRITLFLCTEHDLMKFQGQGESDDSSEEPVIEKMNMPIEVPRDSSPSEVEGGDCLQ